MCHRRGTLHRAVPYPFETEANHQIRHEHPSPSCHRTCDHVNDLCGQKSCFEDYPWAGRQKRVADIDRRLRRASSVWTARPGLSILGILRLRPSFDVSLSRRGLCGDFRLVPACRRHGYGVLCPFLGLCPGGTSRETCFVCPGSLFHDSAYVCLRCLYLFPFVDPAGLVSATGESAWCGGCQWNGCETWGKRVSKP